MTAAQRTGRSASLRIWSRPSLDRSLASAPVPRQAREVSAIDCRGQTWEGRTVTGRKNYLFAGSHDAARRTAVLCSLTRTCAQHGVPPLEYFTAALRRLANGWPVTRLDELLPHAWPRK